MSHLEGEGSLANSDIRLLESGDLADATIVCGDRTWKVHKLILSSRNKWFKAAFHGSMVEATSGKVVLEEQDPDLIEILLRFIYALDIDVPKLRGGKDMPAFCIQLFRLGDFFLLDELKEKATAELKAYIENTLTFVDAETSDGQSPKWVAEILHALEEAYKDGSTKPILKTLLEFVCLNKDKIFRFGDAIALIDKIPEMARDLIKSYFAGDMAAQPRAPRFRLGLPVLAAVRSPGDLYDLNTANSIPSGTPKMPYLLYPILNHAFRVFAVVSPKTDREITCLKWMAPDPTRVVGMTSHPESEIVRVQTDDLGPNRVLYIRFEDCGDARLYVERYCRAIPAIVSITGNSGLLLDNMRLRVTNIAGRL
ncbi:Kelch-like protein 5 [Diaporthe eres]